MVQLAAWSFAEPPPVLFSNAQCSASGPACRVPTVRYDVGLDPTAGAVAGSHFLTLPDPATEASRRLHPFHSNRRARICPALFRRQSPLTAPRYPLNKDDNGSGLRVLVRY